MLLMISDSLIENYYLPSYSGVKVLVILIEFNRVPKSITRVICLFQEEYCLQ